MRQLGPRIVSLDRVLSYPLACIVFESGPLLLLFVFSTMYVYVRRKISRHCFVNLFWLSLIIFFGNGKQNGAFRGARKTFVQL